MLFRFAHKINSIAVGQIEIADQDIEFHLAQTGSRGIHIFSRNSLAPAPLE